jgi:hypothetical protein
VRFLLCLHLADSPRGLGGQSAPSLFVGCSSCSCSPFVSILRGFEFSLGEVSDGPRVPGGRCGCLADSPRAPRGRSVIRGRLWRFCLLFRTVRGAGPDGLRCVCADSPRQQAGRSAWPVRTVRPTWPNGPPEPKCFVPWFDSSLPSFVLPRVLQGIVPMTRG